MLSPVDHKDSDTEPTLTLAHLDGLDLRRAVDGWHGIWHVDGVAHQFWLPEAVPAAAAFYAVTLPMGFLPGASRSRRPPLLAILQRPRARS